MIGLKGIRTQQSTLPYPMASPVGGLNGRDPLASMPPTDAYLMDNIVPKSAYCEARKGCIYYSLDTLGAPVQTLEVYSGAVGDQLLAWAGTKVFNVTDGEPVEIGTGMSSALSINTMFSNAADNGQHLISVTGSDTPKRFDGTTFSNLAMTGVPNASMLNFVFTFKGRLYFGHKDKLGFYYLPPGQIQGELQYFDLGAVARLGGKLVAIASYSEAGETPNDYIVFITSKGECIGYAGSDPSSAEFWSLVGRYFSAPPIGPRCAVYYNNELTLLTVEGALSFSLIRERGQKQSGVEGAADYAVTAKLGRFITDYTPYKNPQGWSATQYPAAGLLIINVPASGSLSGDYYQYAMNTATRSWCRFTGWNAMTFAVFNGDLYYGRYDGYIMRAYEGFDDAGVEIKVDCKQAYSYFADDRGAGPLQKHFQWATLTVECEGTPPLTGKFSVNFKEKAPSYSIHLPEVSGPGWDVTAWNESFWAAQGEIRQVTITLNEYGYAGSLWLRAVLLNVSFKWYSTQFTFEKTAGLSPV